MFSAFQSRSIDVSWGGAVPAIVGAAQGVPLKIIALGSVTDNALVVKNNGPVKKLSDLAGKKIGHRERLRRLLCHGQAHADVGAGEQI